MVADNEQADIGMVRKKAPHTDEEYKITRKECNCFKGSSVTAIILFFLLCRHMFMRTLKMLIMTNHNSKVSTEVDLPPLTVSMIYYRL